MTQENRETMQRALGIIEGAMYGASEKVQDALALATELIDSVMDSEVKNEQNKKRILNDSEPKSQPRLQET